MTYHLSAPCIAMTFRKIKGDDYVRFKDLINYLKVQQDAMDTDEERELFQILIKALIRGSNAK